MRISDRSSDVCSSDLGYVQAFAIYFDTMLVCTSTAFLILATGKYNVYAPAGAAGTPLYAGLPGVEEGPGYAQAAVESVLPGWEARFVALALFFFAFTTIMAYCYLAEPNLSYLTDNRRTSGESIAWSEGVSQY